MDWLSSLATEVLSHLLALIIMLVGTALLTWAKAKKKEWADTAQYALSVFVLLFVSVVAFHVMRSVQVLNPISQETAEQTIRGWLEPLQVPIKKVDEPDAVFVLGVTMSNDVIVGIVQPKRKPDTILVTTNFDVGKRTLELFNRLSHKDQLLALQRMRASLIPLHLASANLFTLPPQHVDLQEQIPLASLTQRSLIDAMLDVDVGIIALDDALNSEFLEHGLETDEVLLTK